MCVWVMGGQESHGDEWESHSAIGQEGRGGGRGLRGQVFQSSHLNLCQGDARALSPCQRTPGGLGLCCLWCADKEGVMRVWQRQGWGAGKGKRWWGLW